MQLVVDGRAVAPVELAVTRRTRNRGLLGRDGIDDTDDTDDIDTAHLDRSGRVLHPAPLRPVRSVTIAYDDADARRADRGWLLG